MAFKDPSFKMYLVGELLTPNDSATIDMVFDELVDEDIESTERFQILIKNEKQKAITRLLQSPYLFLVAAYRKEVALFITSFKADIKLLQSTDRYLINKRHLAILAREEE